VENALYDEEPPLGGFATNIKGKLSRSCSPATTHYVSAKGSMSQLTNASQTSLVPESRTIDLEATVAILQELRKTASPEDLVALRAYKKSNRLRFNLTQSQTRHCFPPRLLNRTLQLVILPYHTLQLP
jgi:hypothetical protein